MLIFTKKAALREKIESLKKQGLTIGFVPTMGALHKGHVSLLEASKQACDVTVCSVFVNPTQFNDKADLERYPRTPEKDIEILKNADCDIVFMPESDEIYKNAPARKFDLGYLNTILEAAHRPGHFDGVAQVVNLLFEIINPDKAFFGSKDYQQVMVVKKMVELTHSEVEIVACPIIREPDGLAMSSRNTLLNTDERILATKVAALLNEAKHQYSNSANPETVKKNISAKARLIENSRLDYFEIADAETLLPVKNWSPQIKPVALIAIYIGQTRLIDNLMLS